jgi:hypothetical protein
MESLRTLTSWPGMTGSGLTIGLLLALWVYLRGRSVMERRAAKSGPPAEAAVLAPESSEPDPFVHGSPDERRVATRRPGNPVAILISDAEARAIPVHGLVVERSLRGLYVELDEPLTEGNVLSVRAANVSAMVPWVQVKVKNSRKLGAGWGVGCEFLRTPPSSVLWLFG